jgi:hypothetical protein
MAFALTALVLAARNSGEGYEDDAGFHLGQRRTSRARVSRLVKPLLQERLKIMLMPDVPISSLILAPGASPKPPRMDLQVAESSNPAGNTSLLPANLSRSALNVQLPPVDTPAPKRKRKAAVRKDDPTDGTQLGFPGFAA